MLLSAEHLSINFGSRQLLEDVNFYLNEGDKVGVIGINGTGKSTPVTTQKQSSQYTENIAEVSDAYPAKGAGLKKERKYPT